MTTPFQPGQHPDADQLNAFVEHTLPLHEQQATLAHLATCSDCRAIVYLAQPPAPEPHPKPVHARAPLFARWMLAFPAAAALACLIFLTIHFRNPASNQIAVPTTAHIETPPPPSAPPGPATTPTAVRTPPAALVPAPRATRPAASPSPHATPPPASFGYASAPKHEIATETTRPEKKRPGRDVRRKLCPANSTTPRPATSPRVTCRTAQLNRIAATLARRRNRPPRRTSLRRNPI